MKDFQNPPDPVSQVLGITSMCQHAQPKTHLYLYGFTHRKSDFKTESVTKQKKGHFLIREMLLHWENITGIHGCAPNHKASEDTEW